MRYCHEGYITKGLIALGKVNKIAVVMAINTIVE